MKLRLLKFTDLITVFAGNFTFITIWIKQIKYTRIFLK